MGAPRLLPLRASPREPRQTVAANARTTMADADADANRGVCKICSFSVTLHWRGSVPRNMELSCLLNSTRLSRACLTNADTLGAALSHQHFCGLPATLE
ncbi:hypothetical protein AAFF_G00174070 [Aldrovandia affinis]|uniref:Uncharacterized protein n=1 Tax=Aldrovandia affinis TaxID=143900 RepID=A0AAD7WVS2_9TELE|nr:hypothetical protein AAFF_G00174070 [Aldrovandia affinis]